MSGPTRRPQVALTFHGAGDLGLATSILQIVKARKAKITVMAIGTWLQDNPQMADRILAGGHELGNHTYQHLDINSLPAQEITSEIVRCRDVLQKLTGSPGAYFRQSQAQHASDQVKDLAGAAGYATCLSYNLDSLDFTDPGGPAVRATMKAATRGAIVSMHLGHQSTVDALPGVLDDLRARGLEPVTVSTLLAG
jgi:peptidoglycan/xylan/chitin deacetylase (PgdA/CDA1 family)